jgi:hypothetical protein
MSHVLNKSAGVFVKVIDLRQSEAFGAGGREKNLGLFDGLGGGGGLNVLHSERSGSYAGSLLEVDGEFEHGFRSFFLSLSHNTNIGNKLPKFKGHARNVAGGFSWERGGPKPRPHGVTVCGENQFVFPDFLSPPHFAPDRNFDVSVRAIMPACRF